jgi:hypothetical protein
MRAAPDAAVIPLAMLAMLALLGARDRTPPLESCRGSLAGIWREEEARGDQRWAVIDVGDASGTRVEAYPLFDDTAETAAADAAAQLVRSPRSLDLIRSPALTATTSRPERPAPPRGWAADGRSP